MKNYPFKVEFFTPYKSNSELHYYSEELLRGITICMELKMLPRMYWKPTVVGFRFYFEKEEDQLLFKLMF